MKYPYMVKFNGNYYSAGTEVPVGDEVHEKKESISAPASESDVIETNEADEKIYSKSDISRMNVEGLKELAVELGLEVTEKSTGKDLKTDIIAKLGL